MKLHAFLLATVFAVTGYHAEAQAPLTIYSYAIGNWRNGPLVEISPLFETTEQFTTPQLIAKVRKEWPQAFTDTTDIDIQRFATTEEGNESRITLKAKYARRKLQVDMVGETPVKVPVEGKAGE